MIKIPEIYYGESFTGQHGGSSSSGQKSFSGRRNGQLFLDFLKAAQSSINLEELKKKDKKQSQNLPQLQKDMFVRKTA